MSHGYYPIVEAHSVQPRLGRRLFRVQSGLPVWYDGIGAQSMAFRNLTSRHEYRVVARQCKVRNKFGAEVELEVVNLDHEYGN
jgi:hypothetical protein